MNTGIGATLREAREAQGRSLEDAAGSVRARVAQLRALEEEDFASFGGDVYAKGFLKSYAQALGLDPAPLLDTYRREVGPPEVQATALVGNVGGIATRRGAPPAWMAWLLVGVVAVAGVVLFALQGDRAPDTADPDLVVGAPPTPVEDDDVEDEPESEGDDPRQDEVDGGDEPGGGSDDQAEGEGDDDATQGGEPEPDGVDLLLAMEDPVWMSIVVDGSVVFEQTVPAGETLQYQGEQEIRVRFGNAGGVRVQLNGEDLGPQGSRGEVVNVRFTPDGAELL